MALHRTRIGLHARNDVRFPAHDYELVRRARIETMKMMSFTDVTVFARLRQENPQMEFIVRLYDDRIRQNSQPSAAQFVARMVPLINRLKPYVVKFEIHNEPNHADRIEGWGASDEQARAFRLWYMQVLAALKKACPWAQFGFPGLALNEPHRDLAWLDICWDVIKASDWLGCHCYWQYGNMLDDRWGLRFRLYHQRFPDKPIEITEFGNSTPNLPREEIARQYAQYYSELSKYPYLGSACSFIASSPDPAWAPFVWAKESGELLPVVHSIGNMERKPVDVTPPPPPVTERTFPQTGKTVRGKFLEFFDHYGLDICGYPITEQFAEAGLQSQYFERIGLEILGTGEFRLKPVGTEAWTSRSQIAGLKARSEELGQLLVIAGHAQPPIKDIVGDLTTHATQQYATRPLKDIRYLVIHHTATKPTVTPQQLAEYQVRKQGKAGIAYHFCIAAEGTIYQTNRLKTVSDHAAGRNETSIGICFPGNFTTAIPTDAQLEGGGELCAWLIGCLGLPLDAIVGVSEFLSTQSPGNQWLSGQRWKDKLLEKVQAALKASAAGQIASVASVQRQGEFVEGEVERPTWQPSPLPLAWSQEPAPSRVSRPPIQDLINQLPRHATKQYETRTLSEIRSLVIHHSATPSTIMPRRIAEYHVRKHDWPGIGYHFLVAEDGSLFQANALETVSHHAATANQYGVGICFLGDFTAQVPPPAQLRAGAHLVAWLMQELNITLENVKGHRELMDTVCPGDQWLIGQKWGEMLRQDIARVYQESGGPSPSPAPGAKAIYHYLLFWSKNGEWAVGDWLIAQDYIRTFRPTCGFSTNDAALAQYVTIVGGTSGVSEEVEDRLRAAGCKVERIAGDSEAATKQLLDNLVQQGTRFQQFEG